VLVVFSKSVVLRTKVPFNRSEVIPLYFQVACQIRSIRVTLHLGSLLWIFIAELPLQFSAELRVVTLHRLIPTQPHAINHQHGRSWGTHELYPPPPNKELLCYRCTYRSTL